MRRLAVHAVVVLSFVSWIAADTKRPVSIRVADLVVEKPVVTNADGWLNAMWLVRNSGNQSSPATHLQVTCKSLQAGGKSRCASPSTTVEIPPLVNGSSYTAKVDRIARIEGGKGPYRFSIVAKADPSNAVSEWSKANNEVAYTEETPAKAEPHLQLTTDPARWDFSRPFWLVLHNVDPKIDAKNISVTMTCDTLTKGGPLGTQMIACPKVPGVFDLPVPYQINLALVPHGSLMSAYQVRLPIGPTSGSAYSGMRLTFHVKGGIAPDLVLTALP